MRRYPDGGAGGVWSGYCVVHIRRAGYLTVDRCHSTRGRRVGYYNDSRRPSDYIWAGCSVLHCWVLVTSVLAGGAPTAGGGSLLE